MTMSRRLFFITSALAAAAMAGTRALAQTLGGGMADYGSMTLRDALAKRESIRTYSQTPIEDAQLLALLWAANGINRPDVGGRTAPSWRTALDTEIYVARASGIDRFDAANNSLIPVSSEDVRKTLSPQPFVGTAPVVLIYVSELSKLLAAANLDPAALDLVTEDHRIAAHVNAAVVSQNAYLFCAAEGLGTCLVGGADRAAAAKALSLGEGQIVTYVQPVGHPA